MWSLRRPLSLSYSAPYQRQRRGQRQVSSMDSRKDVGVRSRLGFPGSGGSQGVRRSGWNKVTVRLMFALVGCVW